MSSGKVYKPARYTGNTPYILDTIVVQSFRRHLCGRLAVCVRLAVYESPWEEEVKPH